MLLSEEQRILSLDIGTKRIGLALWEPKTRWITPLPVRTRKTLKEDLAFFSKLLDEKKLRPS